MTTTPSNESRPKPYCIVVGLAFDATDEAALREAARLALHRGDATVHVVHAIAESTTTAGGLERLNDALASVPVRLRGRIAVLREKAGMPTLREAEVHVRIGEPTQAIHQLAVDVEADLIVVGTHGRRGLQRAVLGSVAEALVRTAHCPVLVAHPKNYEGLTRSAAPDPVCPDCRSVREQTAGATVWCEYHARPQVRPHAYSYRETFSLSPHDPGIVPSGS